GIESLPTEPVCFGETASIGGAWPRSWTAGSDGRYQVRLEFTNRHGPINTGITAAVKRLSVQCAGAPAQGAALVMPHSEIPQLSTAATFTVHAGQRCRFALDDGFNMSYLDGYANYTGGHGGSDGPINEADYRDLKIVKSGASVEEHR